MSDLTIEFYSTRRGWVGQDGHCRQNKLRTRDIFVMYLFFFLLFHLVRLPIIESDLAVPDVIQETGRIG